MYTSGLFDGTQIHEAAKAVANMTKMQSSLALPAQTQMIAALRESLFSANLDATVKAVRKTLSEKIICASDLAYIKLNSTGKGFQKYAWIPTETQMALKDLNKQAARVLSTDSELVYCVNEKKFIKNDTLKNDGHENKAIDADVQEINHLAYGVHTFNSFVVEEPIGGEEALDFTVSELVEFMSFLQQKMLLGLKHPVGEKIYNWIARLKNTNEYVGFDRSEYYHARPMDEGSIPYGIDDMQRAPYGLPGAGRYNIPSQAYYYFTDTEDGARAEMGKHNSGKNVSIVRIRPSANLNVKMLDLKSSRRWGKEFLKFIRYMIDETDIMNKMPRQYLIPNFVSQCCRDSGFDGIVYYGSESYTNYVVWDDKWFDSICMV